jgi:hypothetical protein
MQLRSFCAPCGIDDHHPPGMGRSILSQIEEQFRKEAVVESIIGLELDFYQIQRLLGTVTGG